MGQALFGGYGKEQNKVPDLMDLTYKRSEIQSGLVDDRCYEGGRRKWGDR